MHDVRLSSDPGRVDAGSKSNNLVGGALTAPKSELDPSAKKSAINPDGNGNIKLDMFAQIRAHNPVADLPKATSYDGEEEVARPASSGIALAPAGTNSAQTEVADSLFISEKNVNLVHDCDRRDVTIAVNNSKLFLSGICRSVTIPGSNDEVLVEISNSGKLMISGEHNAVIWSSAEGPEPIVVSTDETNTVIHLRSKSKVTVPLITVEATRLASVPQREDGPAR